ncbi:GntR family transcriptional regulator [Corynebacterium terpenotabidum]|uniref:GntR family transcriptional regulator n=1 Tax=Corynebacterium terpenotabidum Y-11 TaxID=1200352 RepID=S4XC79_9CORY|nr:GntR family transcriptional regulator [Corynebacterium terpenotabidum]AGP30201.1 GntR family transcriptional regulator [Corynebacterium terpenotabidum Y-11]
MRAQSVAAVLRHAVSAGEYAPGTKLNEVAVAEKLGISRNTLREGFATLAADGIIDRIPNRGVFIASPTSDDILSLYRARAVIEPGALQWGDALDVDTLDRIVADAEASVSAASVASSAALAASDTSAASAEAEAPVPTPAATALANQLFHRTVVEAAGSALLNEEMDRLLARMRLVFLTVERVRPGLHSDFVPVNRQIVTLLQAGDRAGAAEALQVSLVKTGTSLASTLRG